RSASSRMLVQVASEVAPVSGSSVSTLPVGRVALKVPWLHTWASPGGIGLSTVTSNSIVTDFPGGRSKGSIATVRAAAGTGSETKAARAGRMESRNEDLPFMADLPF